MSPRVSVIVPLYNKASTVQRTLESIQQQSFSNFEAIVVDDGSSDSGPEIVSRFISNTQDQRFKIVSQTNAGPGAARNRGAYEASSGLIAFLDADDEWLPEYLERSIAVLDGCSQRIGAVSSTFWHMPARVSWVETWIERGLTDGIFRVTPETSGRLLMDAVAYMSPCTTVIRTETFRRYGGFYGDRCLYGEDANLFLKVLLNEPVAFNIEALVKVHVDASGLTNARIRKTPTEPFLTDPTQVTMVCPEPLLPVLREFLAIRALKRSCILDYWGAGREARALRRRFSSFRDWRLPYYLPAMLGEARLLSPLGRALRALQTTRRAP